MKEKSFFFLKKTDMALIFERIKVCILYILPQGALFSCFNVISQVGGIILNQNDFHPFLS